MLGLLGFFALELFAALLLCLFSLFLFELGFFGLFTLGLFLGLLGFQFALFFLGFLFLALLQCNFCIALGLQLLLRRLGRRRWLLPALHVDWFGCVAAVTRRFARPSRI